MRSTRSRDGIRRVTLHLAASVRFTQDSSLMLQSDVIQLKSNHQICVVDGSEDVMARKPSNFVTVREGEVITIGGQVMERAGYPMYLYIEWDANHVTLAREEDYERKHQGIYRVGWGGGKPGQGGQARISAKPIVEGAGLADGRYVPISVDEDKIVIPLTPFQTPDQYAKKKATSMEDDA
jgi:hypothetical protein